MVMVLRKIRHYFQIVWHVLTIIFRPIRFVINFISNLAICQTQQEDDGERLPDWYVLWFEFTNRTTWHGLKYLALPTKFLTRRFIWFCVWFTNFGLLWYIMSTKWDQLISYPTTITVAVVYNDSLPFSAITICNQNLYRLTALQKRGLYDLMVNEQNNSWHPYCDSFGLYRNICKLPRGWKESEDHKVFQLAEITRFSCMSVCVEAYDWYCSSFLYDRNNRTCLLSAYTGDWVYADEQNVAGRCHGLEFYRRKRCYTITEIRCSFEDSLCTLINDTNLNDLWMLVRANEYPLQRDNTLNLGSGHILNLLVTHQRPGYKARILTSTYMNTTGKCLEMFYWLQVDNSMTSESATLSIIAISEEREEENVKVITTGPKDWSRLFVELPSGTNQIAIEGKRGLLGASGISIDDITVQDCNKFDANRNCKISRLGKAYTGDINVTASGEPCLPWVEISSPLLMRLPDKYPENASNFCRNIPQEDWSEPSCFVQTPFGFPLPKPCSVPFCECTDSSYFKCKNGMCLPTVLLCNGIDECLDGSDELDVCSQKRNVECRFDDDYKCGYETNAVGGLKWTRVSASDQIYANGNAITSNVSALEQLMLIDFKYGQLGDQVQLISPVWKFANATKLAITYIMFNPYIQSTPLAGFYMYQYTPLHIPIRILANFTSFSENNLQVSEVCVPSGTYHLMFLGVQGRPYEATFGLDIVSIVGDCNYQDEVTLDETFNCTFATLCGYKFISTSALFTSYLAYTRNVFTPIQQTTKSVCEATYVEIEGKIFLPNYPNNYNDDMDCIFRIEGSSGTTLNLTFVDFDVEPENDCLFDSLQISEPGGNITKIYCGSDIPPPYISYGNVVNLKFKSDSSITFKGFEILYKTNEVTSEIVTDRSIIMYYNGSLPSSSIQHSAQLISPSIRIDRNKCVRYTLFANANFTIKLSSLNVSGAYQGRTLLSSPAGLGSSWHHIHLDIPPISRSGRASLVYETSSGPAKLAAAVISDIRLFDGSCRDLVRTGTLECNFTQISQCGYLDSSEGVTRWIRMFAEISQDYYMGVTFNDVLTDESILESAPVTVDVDSCLVISYYLSSQNLFMEIISSPPLLNSTKFQLDFDNWQYYLDLPAGHYNAIRFRVSNVASGKQDADVIEAKIHSLSVLNGVCPETNASNVLDCSFETAYVCNYKSSSWLWATFTNILKADTFAAVSPEETITSLANHGNVMVFNGSSSYHMKGVLLSPPINIQSNFLLTFEVYSSNNRTTSINVYTTSIIGETVNVSLGLNDSLFSREWQTFSVCIPSGNYQLMFVAEATPGSYIAIDNIHLDTKNICSLSSYPDQACNEFDLSGCPNSYFSWSNDFAWKHTSDIRNDTIIPSSDGCVRVYYEVEGVVTFVPKGKHYMDTTDCDLYIKGSGLFTAQLLFNYTMIDNCSLQYIQIWRYLGDNFTNDGIIWCNDLNNYTLDNPLEISTNNIIQIHVHTFQSFPAFQFFYKYSPSSLNGFQLALQYNLASSSPVYRLLDMAEWWSPVLTVNRNAVCLSMDVALPAGALEVVLLQEQSERVTVFKTPQYNDNNVDWVHAAFQIPLKSLTKNRIQLLFSISITEVSFDPNSSRLVAALNNIYTIEGGCKPDGSLPSATGGNCVFRNNYSCGYIDLSTNSSRWVLVSERSTYAAPGSLCKVSRDGGEFVGNISQTVSGRTCQRWDSQYPQKHNQDVPSYFPDTSLTEASNNCRNPTNPFIPRTAWCYTMDPEQRREYCDIPFCHEYYMKVIFLAGQTNRAILSSPTLNQMSSYCCMTFSYQLASTMLELHVDTATASSPSSFKTQKQFRTNSDTTPFVWFTGFVTLPKNTVKIQFIADALDLIDRNGHVALDNITISNSGACFDSNTTLPNDRVPYNGTIVDRSEYKTFIFEELEELSMTNLTSELAHQREQLFHKCSYGKVDCTDASNFLTEYTDMGQCYTFNFDQSNFLVANTTGAEAGARFLLNIEQYEYVKGYVSGVGVKMHLHDQVDMPQIRDLGLAAAPGLHTLAALNYFQSQSLEPPYGTCGSSPYKYFNSSETPYSEARCNLEKQTEQLEGICECRDIYMPGPSPYCNLDKFMDCVSSNTDSFKTGSSTASCPAACNINTYSVDLSNAKLSGLDIKTLLGSKYAEVQTLLNEALEIRNRVDEMLLTDTIQRMTHLINNYTLLKDFVLISILDRGTCDTKRIEGAQYQINSLMSNDIVVNGGKLVSQFVLVYSRDVKPRMSYLLDFVKRSYADLSMSRDILRKFQSGGVWNSWYSQVINNTRSELLNLNSVLSLADSKMGVNNGYMPNLDGSGLCRQFQYQIISNLCVLDNQFSEIINKTGSGALALLRFAELENITTTLKSMDDFSTCVESYHLFLVEFQNWISSLEFEFVKNYSNAINAERILVQFGYHSNFFQTLLDNYSKNAITKMELSTRMLSDECTSVNTDIDNVIQDINQQIAVPIQASIITVKNNLVTTYSKFLEYLAKLYSFTGSSIIEDFARSMLIWRKPMPSFDMLQPLEFVLSTNETWQVWSQETDLTSFASGSGTSRLTMLSMEYFDPLTQQISSVLAEINNRKDKFSRALNSIQTLLMNYLVSASVDENFVMTNFLAIDIYYGEKKYEKISQAASYLWAAFFADLGSYMGLLMGCSLLTMIEVIDLFVYYTIVKIIERYQDRKPKRRETIEIKL